MSDKIKSAIASCSCTINQINNLDYYNSGYDYKCIDYSTSYSASEVSIYSMHFAAAEHCNNLQTSVVYNNSRGVFKHYGEFTSIMVDSQQSINNPIMIIKAQTQCKLYHRGINCFVNYIEDFVGVQT